MFARGILDWSLLFDHLILGCFVYLEMFTLCVFLKFSGVW